MYRKKSLLLLLLTVCLCCSFGDFRHSKTVLRHSSRVQVTDKDSLSPEGAALEELRNAKENGNWESIALAYQRMISHARGQAFIYADSMLVAALHTDNDRLIGSAYLKKGILYYELKQHNRALDNYIMADGYIARTSDRYLAFKVKYAIAQTKYYLGFYDEAIALLKECIEFFKEENDRAYVNSLHSLALCYNRIGSFKHADKIIALGFRKIRELDIPVMEPYFQEVRGINSYSQKQYRQSIAELTGVTAALAVAGDFANTAVADFYTAKCYWDLNQKEKALVYLLRVDSVFVTKKYIRPDLRENYEMLIKYYEGRNNKELQLVYINRLLEVDRILTQNYKYLSQKMFKEYDTKQLLSARQKIENAMKFSGILMVAFITLLVLLIIVLGYRNKKNSRLFRELMENSPEDKNKGSGNSSVDGMNPKLVAAILRKLEKFEQNKRYLEKDMNLIRIASLLDTNTKYTSRMIVHFRGKKSIEYISDLRIDYIMERLKSESKFRNYTNKALGEEIGFGSTQNFTKAFRQRTGLSPTYFISKLKNKAD